MSSLSVARLCAHRRAWASTLIPLEMWDCPGNITVDTLGAPLSEFASIVFVIDIRVSVWLSRWSTRLISAQDLYQQPIVKLVEFIVAACQVNPNINLEVFVHKAEKLQEDDKIGRILRPPELTNSVTSRQRTFVRSTSASWIASWTNHPNTNRSP